MPDVLHAGEVLAIVASWRRNTGSTSRGRGSTRHCCRNGLQQNYCIGWIDTRGNNYIWVRPRNARVLYGKIYWGYPTFKKWFERVKKAFLNWLRQYHWVTLFISFSDAVKMLHYNSLRIYLKKNIIFMLLKQSYKRLVVQNKSNLLQKIIFTIINSENKMRWLEKLIKMAFKS